ncbi:unnamed protein product [Rotaria sp. Silwood2]|nr:unnamed protein product [Rotaria sp. Silwood2]
MKLCKEANPFMDDASKLQYLKDGLKPSLRFNVLLKNPVNTEEFLQYAQKIEELQTLDEQQDIIIVPRKNHFLASLPINPTLESNISQNMNRSSQNSSPNDNDTQYNINY